MCPKRGKRWERSVRDPRLSAPSRQQPQPGCNLKTAEQTGLRLLPGSISTQLLARASRPPPRPPRPMHQKGIGSDPPGASSPTGFRVQLAASQVSDPRFGHQPSTGDVVGGQRPAQAAVMPSQDAGSTNPNQAPGGARFRPWVPERSTPAARPALSLPFSLPPPPTPTPLPFLPRTLRHHPYAFKPRSFDRHLPVMAQPAVPAVGTKRKGSEPVVTRIHPDLRAFFNKKMFGYFQPTPAVLQIMVDREIHDHQVTILARASPTAASQRSRD